MGHLPNPNPKPSPNPNLRAQVLALGQHRPDDHVGECTAVGAEHGREDGRVRHQPVERQQVDGGLQVRVRVKVRARARVRVRARVSSCCRSLEAKPIIHSCSLATSVGLGLGVRVRVRVRVGARVRVWVRVS